MLLLLQKPFLILLVSPCNQFLLMSCTKKCGPSRVPSLPALPSILSHLVHSLTGGKHKLLWSRGVLARSSCSYSCQGQFLLSVAAPYFSQFVEKFGLQKGEPSTSIVKRNSRRMAKWVYARVASSLLKLLSSIQVLSMSCVRRKKQEWNHTLSSN